MVRKAKPDRADRTGGTAGQKFYERPPGWMIVDQLLLILHIV